MKNLFTFIISNFNSPKTDWKNEYAYKEEEWR